MQNKIDVRRLLFALLLLCSVFFSVLLTNCGGYDNGTGSTFNANDNGNDNSNY